MKKKYMIIFSVVVLSGLLGVLFIAIGIGKSPYFAWKKLFVNTGSNSSINKNYSINSQNIDSIYVEANAIEFIVLENSSSSDIEIAVSDFFREDDFKYDVSGNKLNIKIFESMTIEYRKAMVNHPKVTVKIPKNKIFEVVEIYSKATDSNISNINSKSVFIRNDAGKFVFSGSAYGDIRLYNNMGKLSLNIKEIKDNKSIFIDNKMGDLDIRMPDISKYNYSIKNSVGHVKVGSMSYEGLQNEIISGNGDMNIEIENKMGNVSIF